MENKSKIFSYVVLALTLILLVLLIFITIQGNYYKTDVIVDFMWILPYFIILIISSLIIIIKSEKLISWIKFSINGLLISGGISLLIVLSTALPRLKLIISDGTALWVLIWLPIIFIGYSLVVLGALIGLAVGLIYGKIKHKN